jgi:hypothetical protein
MKHLSPIFQTAVLAMAWFTMASTMLAEEPAKQPVNEEKKADKKPDAATTQKKAEEMIKLSQNRDELAMPGMKILVKKGYIDVEAKICLAKGMLELLACKKDSKEHESLIAVVPKAAHIHAALLLIGAQPGNPAMRKEVETEDGPRWIDLEPRGQEIDVSLVFNNEAGEPTEHPIKEFLIKSEEESFEPKPEVKKEDRAFPTNTFLFVGSHVFKDGEADPVYLADESGNVISLSTFGDELLALPGVHANDNQGLVWSIDPTRVPPLDTKVILRLKPKKAAAAQEPKK